MHRWGAKAQDAKDLWSQVAQMMFLRIDVSSVPLAEIARACVRLRNERQVSLFLCRETVTYLQRRAMAVNRRQCNSMQVLCRFTELYTP